MIATIIATAFPKHIPITYSMYTHIVSNVSCSLMHSRQVNIMSTHSVDKLAVKKLITSKYSKTADDF